MNRIYIEIIRDNNQIDLYRFEPRGADDYNMYHRAWAFMLDQITHVEGCKVWIMKNISSLTIDKYDLIED